MLLDLYYVPICRSISSDSAFSTEGIVIFDAYGNANDDCHPDAHACRLKISLTSLESGRDLPWQITLECAKYIVKYDRITASCVIPEEEEYQLLSNSSIIVTDDSHPLYLPHFAYFYTIVKNRCKALCAINSNSVGQPVQPCQRAECFHPPRVRTANWPYFMDNTVLGEDYSKISEVGSADEWIELFSRLTLPAIQKEIIVGKQIIAPFAAHLALRQYEQYNDKEEDTACLQAVNDSKMSILGWAYGLNEEESNMEQSLIEVKGIGEQQYPPSLDDYETLQVVVFHVSTNSILR